MAGIQIYVPIYKASGFTRNDIFNCWLMERFSKKYELFNNHIHPNEIFKVVVRARYEEDGSMTKFYVYTFEEVDNDIALEFKLRFS